SAGRKNEGGSPSLTVPETKLTPRGYGTSAWLTFRRGRSTAQRRQRTSLRLHGQSRSRARNVSTKSRRIFSADVSDGNGFDSIRKATRLSEFGTATRMARGAAIGRTRDVLLSCCRIIGFGHPTHPGAPFPEHS